MNCSLISNSPIKTLKSILLAGIGAKSISVQYVTTLKIVRFSFLNNRFIFSVQGWIVTLKKRLMFPFLMMFPLIFCDKRFLGLRTVTSSFNMLQFVSWNNSKKTTNGIVVLLQIIILLDLNMFIFCKVRICMLFFTPRFKFRCNSVHFSLSCLELDYIFIFSCQTMLLTLNFWPSVWSLLSISVIFSWTPIFCSKVYLYY